MEVEGEEEGVSWAKVEEKEEKGAGGGGGGGKESAKSRCDMQRGSFISKLASYVISNLEF